MPELKKDELISKQRAIDAMLQLQREDDEMYGVHILEGFDGERAAEKLKELPVEQPKDGKWIKPTGMMPPEYKGVYICSECGEIAMRDWKEFHHQTLTKFCPNCGADMRGDEHGAD